MQNVMRRILPALLVLIAACNGGDAPPVVVANVEVTPPRPGAGMSAGYLDITNNSREPLVITHVTSPEFGKVELHETTVEDGVARMRPLDSLVVPPGETVVLERGGKHLMLMRPVDTPDVVTLSLYSGETLVVSVETPVRREP
jgi:hypothetical protein